MKCWLKCIVASKEPFLVLKLHPSREDLQDISFFLLPLSRKWNSTAGESPKKELDMNKWVNLQSSKLTSSDFISKELIQRQVSPHSWDTGNVRRHFACHNWRVLLVFVGKEQGSYMHRPQQGNWSGPKCWQCWDWEILI